MSAVAWVLEVTRAAESGLLREKRLLSQETRLDLMSLVQQLLVTRLAPIFFYERKRRLCYKNQNRVANIHDKFIIYHTLVGEAVVGLLDGADEGGGLVGGEVGALMITGAFVGATVGGEVGSFVEVGAPVGAAVDGDEVGSFVGDAVDGGEVGSFVGDAVDGGLVVGGDVGTSRLED